jgi:hypothetical protein
MLSKSATPWEMLSLMITTSKADQEKLLRLIEAEIEIRTQQIKHLSVVKSKIQERLNNVG